MTTTLSEPASPSDQVTQDGRSQTIQRPSRRRPSHVYGRFEAGEQDAGVTPLHRFKERRLLFRYHRLGDVSARAELVDRFLPLARRLARRFENSGEPLDDLIQVASVGLLKAIDGFDFTRHTSFSSYAVPTILGELKRYFRDKSWSVHVPRGLRDRAVQVQRARSTASGRDGQMPTLDDIAELTGLSVEEVREASVASEAYDAMSLDAPRRTDDNEGTTIVESLGDEEHGYEVVEQEADLAFPLAMLPEQDRKILMLRFHADLTQSEIADQMGVSQMQVSRLLKHALARTEELAALQ